MCVIWFQSAAQLKVHSILYTLWSGYFSNNSVKNEPFLMSATCMLHGIKGVNLTELLGDIKEDWGSGERGRKSLSGVQRWSPGRENGGQSPPEAEGLPVSLHNYCDCSGATYRERVVWRYRTSVRRRWQPWWCTVPSPHQSH